MGGYLGHQYECPNLAHLVNSEKKETNYSDEDDSYWILFISINPGSLLGGSSTQYLIGQFGRKDNNKDNKYTFTLSYSYLVQLDMGKNFYALQLFYETPTETELDEGYKEIRGIAWTSNWQYSNFVPTDTWRSSMSIPRKLSLGHQNINYVTKVLYLNQEPVLEHDFFKNLEGVEPIVLDGLSQDIIQNIYDAEGKAYGAS
jgi:beta-fructofuranosidase